MLLYFKIVGILFSNIILASEYPGIAAVLFNNTNSTNKLMS